MSTETNNPQSGVRRTVPMRGMRRVIAQRMHESLQRMAQLTLQTDLDVTRMVEWRASLPKTEARPSVNDYLFKCVGEALDRHPAVNAHLIDDQIVEWEQVNVGLAVAVPNGLLVPVMHDVGTLSLPQIGAKRRELVAKAREGALTMDEMTGGTFTVTNLGTSPVDWFTPVINPPEVAILGIGRTRPVAFPEDGGVVFKQMMGVSLTFDHRALDGAPAAEFLATLQQCLDDPGSMSSA